MQMRLNQSRRTKKWFPECTTAPLDISDRLKYAWPFYFMNGILFSGQEYRVLNILHEVVGEDLDNVVDTSIAADQVGRTLEQIAAERGFPRVIRVDNGSEINSQVFTDWCEAHNILIDYIQLGKPNQNVCIGQLNRSFREEVLDPYLLSNLKQVREISSAWRLRYKDERPHESWDDFLPAEFKRQLNTENSNLDLCD